MKADTSSTSNKFKYNIGLFERLSDEAMDFLNKYSKVYILDSPFKWNFSKQIASEFDALIIRAKGSITGDIMKQCSNLKVIGRHGVGIDNIDVDAARNKGIKIFYTPNANFNAVAEFIIGLMLSLCRNIVKADSFVKANQNWLQNHQLVGNELFNKNLGIIGAGRISKRLAEIANFGFQMNVILYDYKNRQNAIKNRQISITDDLNVVLKNSDFLSINIPSKPETRNMFDRQMLDKIKNGCFVINTSRGDLIDEDYLLELLKNNKLGGVALDVFRNEPFCSNTEHKKLYNFITTPHIGYLTQSSLKKMSNIVVDVINGLKGKINSNHIYLNLVI